MAHFFEGLFSPLIRRKWLALAVVTAIAGGFSLAQDDNRYKAPENLTKVGQALNSRITIQFEDTHISTIIEYISYTCDIPILLDERVVAPEERPGPGRQKDSSHFVTNGWVSRANYENTTLNDVLDALLPPLGLGFRPGRRQIFISTPAVLKGEDTQLGPIPLRTIKKPDIPATVRSAIPDETEQYV